LQKNAFLTNFIVYVHLIIYDIISSVSPFLHLEVNNLSVEKLYLREANYKNKGEC